MKHYIVVLILVLTMSLLAACGDSTPAPQESVDQATEQPTLPAATDTAPPPPPTAEAPAGPAVGGKVVMNFEAEVDTLDISKAMGGMNVLGFVGASLTALDPETMQVVPYLAKDWTISDDGLTYEFTLRDDVTFHNGAPLTAEDYAWTIQRMMDPEIGSNCVWVVYPAVSEVEAVDEHTLRITLFAPNYYFLAALADSSCGQPMSKAYAQEAGDELGSKPIGAGPFRFKSWEPGVKVVLERNPDFSWGPSFTHGGPPYIETLEIRGIFDHSLRLAALEAGELDLTEITIVDVERVKSTGQHQVLEMLPGGSADSVLMNQTRPPLDDLRVRQALNLALDRDLLNKVMENGKAEPIHGLLSSSTRGYCAEAAEHGYDFDLEKAKELMAEAGYTPRDDGMLQKDGEPLVLVMPVFSFYEKMAVLVQEQYKALGVQVELEQGEVNMIMDEVMQGNFDLYITAYLFEDTSLLEWMFSSNMIGAYNFSQISDPKMDELLATMMTTMDAEVNSQAACDIQIHAVEQAYTVPIYLAKAYTPVGNDLKGVRWFRYGRYDLFDAYLETE